MNDTLTQLVADYTARGWTFDNDHAGSGYYVQSPFLATLSPAEDFWFDPKDALLNPADFVRNGTERERLEDALLAREAGARADALYADLVWEQFGAAHADILRQCATLLRKGITPADVNPVMQVTVPIHLKRREAK